MVTGRAFIDSYNAAKDLYNSAPLPSIHSHLYSLYPVMWL